MPQRTTTLKPNLFFIAYYSLFKLVKESQKTVLLLINPHKRCCSAFYFIKHTNRKCVYALIKEKQI